MKLLFEDDHRCFVCGMENPDGLRIAWHTEGISTQAEFTADRKFQGWKGVLHGGIVATLLDEAMTRLACELYGSCVTAEMTVRYVHPVPTQQKLIIQGEVVLESRRLIQMKSALSDLSGKLLAHAAGKVMRV